MSGHRVFYVKQGSLSVWMPEQSGLTNVAEFSDDDSGLQAFDNHLAKNADRPSVIVIDVIEEEFALESIPRLGIRDRRTLIENRNRRRFRRTPYRAAIYHGRSGRDNAESNVIYSAISNHELLDPWIRIALRHQTPLSGVHSVPLMAGQVFKKLFAVSGTAMFVAPHQGSKLRQVFFRNGKLQGARLSQCSGVSDGGYGQSIVSEATRSRRYLERNRLLSPMENFSVCVVADDATATKIADLSQADGTFDYRFIEPLAAARKLGHAVATAADRFETVYLSLASHRRPRYSYATSGEDRYWNMRRVRDALIRGAVAVGAVCSVGAALLLSDALLLKSRIAAIQLQVTHLAETYRRENEKFSPIRADSHEMKIAVDTGEYLLAHRLPVPWVMNQLSVVLEEYPDIQVRKLQWLVEAPAGEGVQKPRRSGEPLTVAVPELRTISAELSASFVSFDGDMRKAFARIDALAADFESRTSFHRSLTVEYPFDARTSSSVSGEIIQQRDTDTADFRVRLAYDVPEHGRTQQGKNDEST